MKIVDNILECTCGELHQLDPDGMSGCQWINCDCGERFCGTCGSTYLEDRENVTDEDYLWCNRGCIDCGANGCAECI